MTGDRAPAGSVDAARPKGGDCPDPNSLAGFAEGGLLPDERALVAAHWQDCPHCREAVSALVREGREGAPTGPRSRGRMRTVWRWVAVSMSAAAAVLAGFLLLRSHGEDPDDGLRLAARRLAAEHPDPFEGFLPLSAAERRADPGRRERAGLQALYPAEKVLETRPRLRWEGAPGMDRYEVALYSRDGVELWRTRTSQTSTDLQTDLEPGMAFVWEVSGRGPLGDDRAQRRFEVATAEERAAFERALRTIAEEAPPALVPLLQAHFAIRGGLYGEAERRVRALLARQPDDRVGRETLLRILRQFGASEADGLLAGSRH